MRIHDRKIRAFKSVIHGLKNIATGSSPRQVMDRVATPITTKGTFFTQKRQSNPHTKIRVPSSLFRANFLRPPFLLFLQKKTDQTLQQTS